MLRSFAVGYNYPSSLSTVYKTLQNLPTEDLPELVQNTAWIIYRCAPYVDSKGLEQWAENPDVMRDPIHAPWRFANAVIDVEHGWRPGLAFIPGITPERHEEMVQAKYARLCEMFGENIMQATFGENGPPWTKERHRSYEEDPIWH
jgi:hypothetical protein